MAKYLPQKGDFVALSFDPQSGHEQKGQWSALVISNDLFNKHTGLAIVCPLTKTDRRIPFHLAAPPASGLAGFVMVDQVKSIDYAARKAKFIGRAPGKLLADVLGVLDACLK
ncbi:MAG: type II toxin-antitoxin system PemK/MazF family toxin [Acidobacteria bacterium]|nr:type II toxin-antitoxin system PemK/MazF family toxin [Acidobacteriota bacterium]MCI0721153.1 type II toxin-antitoxin system PemK/MazF family toxin [Acidobacteriota bacterium]